MPPVRPERGVLVFPRREMSMTTLQRVLDLLEKTRAPFTHTTHPLAYTARDVAASEHLPPHEMAKTVVFHTAEGYGMAVTPADCVVDLEELRVVTQSPQIRLATEAELGALFPDSELGAMPPLGLLAEIPIIVDEQIASQKSIAFNAGTHKDLIRLSYADYARLAHPRVAAIARAAAGAVG